MLAGEAFFPSLNGRATYLFGKASVLYDSRGSVVGAIESLRDITSQKLMEEAVGRADEKYTDIFENSVTSIYQTTIKGRFLNLNMSLAHMPGYDSPEELLNEASNVLPLYVHPERRSEMLTHDQAKRIGAGFRNGVLQEG